MVVIDVPGGVVVPRIEGDAATADELGRRIVSAASRYEDFGDGAVLASVAVHPQWQGTAFDAFASDSRRVAKDHDLAATALGRVGRACAVYADTLRDQLAEHERLVDHQAGLDARRRDLVADIDATTDADESVVEALRSRSSSLSRDYQGLQQDVDGLLRRVRENDDLLRSAFERSDTVSEVRAGTADPEVEAVMGRSGAPGRGSTPEQVRAWWRALSPAMRDAVIAAHPATIGRTDGLPAVVRDVANRLSLDVALVRLGTKDADGTLDSLERRALVNAKAAQKALDRADSYVDPTSGERPGGQLWLFDPTAFGGEGRVAVAVGDLDTADDVAVRVPGIKTNGSDAPLLTREAINVHQSARFEGDGSSVASMMWLGYDTPDGVAGATLTEARAEDGGARFADAVDGLRATRPDDPAHLTAIGHSYGSTALAHAATDAGMDVDDIVLVGSPGAGGGVDHASDLGVDADHVFVGRNSSDPVAQSGDEGSLGVDRLFGAGLGRDPSEDRFGAARFQAEDVYRPPLSLPSIAQHSNYFDLDTESLFNIGRIVDGQPHGVHVARHSFDYWAAAPIDPEVGREPRAGVPGQSQTRPGPS